MGFGTFFIGYFLLLNIVRPALTDAIAAAVMMLGLARLEKFNRGFKAAFISSGVFFLFSLFELGGEVSEMLFSAVLPSDAISYIAIARALIVCILTFTSFEGMREVSDEVGLHAHARRCRLTAYLSLPIYVFAIATETPVIFSAVDVRTATVLAVISLLLGFIFIIFNLFSIYTCYARICMPEDVDNDVRTKEKSSSDKESFRDAYKRQKEERELEKKKRKDKK